MSGPQDCSRPLCGSQQTETHNTTQNTHTTPNPHGSGLGVGHRDHTPNPPPVGQRGCGTSFGGHSARETPGHIPNPEAKTRSADGTAGATLWESRTPPDIHSKRAAQGWAALFGLTAEPRGSTAESGRLDAEFGLIRAGMPLAACQPRRRAVGTRGCRRSRDDPGAPRHPDLRWSDGESPGRRAEPVPAGARRQSRGLVPVGRGGLRGGAGTRRARAHLHRLRHVPLVPRDGPRELQRSGDRADPERALRRGEGRPRGASRRRRQLPRRRLRVHARARLAAHGLRDPRRARVLRRHVLPAAARARRSGVRGGARRRRRGVARPASGSRRHGGGGGRGPRRGIRRTDRGRAARRARPRPRGRRPRRGRGPAARRVRASPEVPGRPGARLPRARRRGRPRPRRALAAAHGRLAAARSRRGRVLPLRHPRRLERAALRAHAHRQRPAARRRRGAGRRRRSADVPAVARRWRHRVPPRADAAAERRIRERAGLGERHRR